MTNKETLKKRIVYRSSHRGTKEMDLLLGNFVKFYINSLNDIDLQDLENLILLEDEIIYKWYYENVNSSSLQVNKVTDMLKKFKL